MGVNGEDRIGGMALYGTHDACGQVDFASPPSVVATTVLACQARQASCRLNVVGREKGSIMIGAAVQPPYDESLFQFRGAKSLKASRTTGFCMSSFLLFRRGAWTRICPRRRDSREWRSRRALAGQFASRCERSRGGGRTSAK